jgi:hypothetical protein
LEIVPAEASEQPDIGYEMAGRFSLFRAPPYRITGWERRRRGTASEQIPNVSCGLYLENGTSRAGRHVQLVIRIRCTPPLENVEFIHNYYKIRKQKESGEWDEKNGYFLLSIRFSEKLVVYEAPVLVGGLFITWEEDIDPDDRPQELILEYDAHTLDGTSHGKLELEIVEWE